MVEDVITIKARKQLLVTFLSTELFTIILILAFQSSWFYILPLTLINGLGYWLLNKWLKSELKKSINKSFVLEKYNSYTSGRIAMVSIFNLIAGSAILLFSFFSFPKLYGAGVATILMTLYGFVSKATMSEKVLEHTKHLSDIEAKKVWTIGRLGIYTLFLLVPFLLDFNYMILGIPIQIYAWILVIYFFAILVLCIFESQRFLKGAQ